VLVELSHTGQALSEGSFLLACSSLGSLVGRAPIRRKRLSVSAVLNSLSLQYLPTGIRTFSPFSLWNVGKLLNFWAFVRAISRTADLEALYGA